MTSIKISDLCPAGSELFKDSESFMTELVDNEQDSINGGLILVPNCNYLTANSPFCHPITNKCLSPYLTSPLCVRLPKPMPTPPPPAS